MRNGDFLPWNGNRFALLCILLPVVKFGASWNGNKGSPFNGYAEPLPIIQAYIDLSIQTLASARMLTPLGPTGQTHWGDAASNNPNPSTHSAGAQLKLLWSWAMTKRKMPNYSSVVTSLDIRQPVQGSRSRKQYIFWRRK